MMGSPLLDEPDFEDETNLAAERRAVGKAVKSLAATVAKKHGAKPFPAAAQKLIQITGEPSYRVNEVVKVAESDPMLASELLKQVNSAAMGRRSRCKSVHQAVTMLGARTVRSIAMTTGVFSMFDDISTGPAAAVVAHGSSVGALARSLAPLVGLAPDEMFTCGLLHDVGKLMLLDGDDLDYTDLLASNQEFDMIHVHERERYGYDHAVLAGHVLKMWNIPAPVPRVVSWHHQPTRAFKNGGSISKMVAVLRVADRLAYEFAKGQPADGALSEAFADDAALKHLRLAGDALEILRAKLFRAANEGSKVFTSLAPGSPDEVPDEAMLTGVRNSLRAAGLLEDGPNGRRSEPLVLKGLPRDLQSSGALKAAAALNSEAPSAQLAAASLAPGLASDGFGALRQEGTGALGLLDDVSAFRDDMTDDRVANDAVASGFLGDVASASFRSEAPSSSRFRAAGSASFRVASPPPLPIAELASSSEARSDPTQAELEAAFFAAVAASTAEAETTTPSLERASRAPTATRNASVLAAAAATCGLCREKPGATKCPRCETALCKTHTPADGGICERCRTEYIAHRRQHLQMPITLCVIATIFLLVGVGIGISASLRETTRPSPFMRIGLPVLCAEVALMLSFARLYRKQRARFLAERPAKAK